MLQIQRAVAHASAVVLGHSYSSDVQRQVADVLFAKASADGQLSASLGELFPTGAGVTITPKTPLHFVPEEYGLSSAHLKRIDSIALDGIRQGAYPGCQVVVLKNGHIMFDKAFGTYTGKGSPRVESTNIYDLASLFNIYHIVAFADDNFCIDIKRRHNGLDLARFGLCRADDLKMVKLLRITDRS